MTIAFESGYSLPSGDLPLNYARVLHAGRVPQVRKVIASDELTDYPGSAATFGETADRWRPFENQVQSPDDFSEDDWTLDGLTVGDDGSTVTEDTSTGLHRVTQNITFTAVEWVVALKVRLSGGRFQCRLRADDGTTVFSSTADFSDLTTSDSNSTGDVVDLGDGEYLVRMYFTPLAVAGDIQVSLADDGGSSSYTGDDTQGMTWRLVSAHPSAATLRYDLYRAGEADVFAIAAHNLGLGGGRVTIEHDSDEDDTWTAIGEVEPSNDSPIMFIFAPVTSVRWRITVDRCALPEIGVLRVGSALQMERPFYGGYAPTPMNRKTSIEGNISGSGELLGRSRRRTILSSEYSWSNLTYTWVRENLDGPGGLINSAEVDGLFVAWRSNVTQDVDYVMRAMPQAPKALGQRNLFAFSMGGEVHSYE